MAILQPPKQREASYCEKHQKHFVRFYGERKGHYSWGCPDCVAIIRAQVQKVLRPPVHWLDRMKGKQS